jgi:chromosome segregation ATPase
MSDFANQAAMLKRVLHVPTKTSWFKTLQAGASRKEAEVSARIACLQEELEDARSQANNALHDQHAAETLTQDLKGRLDGLQTQHTSLLVQHRTLEAAKLRTEDDYARLEQQLLAHRENSARALQQMEEHLRQLSTVARRQHQEIVFLQDTVQWQCRERATLQQKLRES